MSERAQSIYAFAPEHVELVADALVTVGFAPEIAHRAFVLTRFIPSFAPDGVVRAWHQPFVVGARYRGVGGITLGSSVYLAKSDLLRKWPLLVHECAHVAQVLERGLPLFLLRYGAEYLLRRARGQHDQEAYLQLSDERQARNAEEAAKHRSPASAPYLVALQ